MEARVQPPAPNSAATERVARWLRKVADIGARPGDSDALRLRKAALTLAALTVTLLAFVWVGVYFTLGLPVSAAIPLGYQVAAAAGLADFARTGNFGRFRFGNLALMSVLPFVLQWSLGGYVASSAVSLWALVAALGALFFLSPRAAIPWFALFVLLTVVSGVLDPLLAANPAPIPDPVRIAFFVLNILGVAVTAYVLLQYSVRARDAALDRTDRLLRNVLPGSIADRLKHAPGIIADRHESVTVLFADIADFTPFAERTTPERLVGVLDEVFSAFDDLVVQHDLEKIKTIGDAYMAVGGLPEPRADHADAVMRLALDMHAELARVCGGSNLDLRLRIGIASGPVVAGVIGRRRLLYDLWGDTVNMASRMESHGIPDRIQATEATVRLLEGRYAFEARGAVNVKGKGRLDTYLYAGPDRTSGS